MLSMRGDSDCWWRVSNTLFRCLRSLHGRYVEQSSLGHALRSLYLVAIAEGEFGECYRSGDELELPYMRVSFHRREPCVQRLSRSRL